MAGKWPGDLVLGCDQVLDLDGAVLSKPVDPSDAVAQITERGYPVREVSERLGVSAYSLYAWKKKFAKASSGEAEKDAEKLNSGVSHDGNAPWVTSDITVSTVAGQTPIAPGDRENDVSGAPVQYRKDTPQPVC